VTAPGEAGSFNEGGGGTLAPWWQTRGGGFDPAQIFARRDSDGDGKLTGGEISGRMQGNCDQFDTNQNGTVTLEEFQTGIQQMRANFGGGGGFGGDSQEGGTERPERPE